MQSALMTAPTAYMVFTVTGETVLVNDAFHRVTGFDADDLPDIRACMEKMRRVPPDQLQTVLDGWLRHQTSASCKEVQVFTAWNEMRVWEIRTTDPVLWPDGRRVILQSMFDFTEQRRLEEALRRS